jgi:Phytanoyl-CoA dioxygenase (PhyH)
VAPQLILGAQVEISFPQVDYQKHPAFGELRVTHSVDEAKVDSLIAEIDSEFAALRLRLPLEGGSLLSEFDAAISSRVNALKAEIARSCDLRKNLLGYALPALESAKGVLLEQLQFDSFRRSHPAVPQSSGVAAQRLEAMFKDGYVQFDADGAVAARVWEQTWWERAYLNKRARELPGRHCAIALYPYSPGAITIQRTIRANGILAIAAAYMGCEMEWMYAALDYSHERQNWYKGCYADAGLPSTDTVYMHLDADVKMVKAMLYLTDVSPLQGPFRYVRGSHRWARSLFVQAVQKGFDGEQTKLFPMEDDGLDYKGGYYRPRFQSIPHRQDVLDLPRALRGTTHFGDDVLNGSAHSRLLLDHETSFVAPRGTMVLFDGSSGIHRGSQVVRGERWAVQIGMRAVTASPRGNLRTALRPLVGRLRYQVRRARGPLQ